MTDQTVTNGDTVTTTIKIGRSYPFFSTMQGEDTHGTRLRDYTGYAVRVLDGYVFSAEADPESEGLYRVRADDGTEFDAFEGELNGHYRDTAQFFWPLDIELEATR